MKALLIHEFYKDFCGEDSHVLSLLNLLRENKIEAYLFKKEYKDIPQDFYGKVKVTKGLFFKSPTLLELLYKLKNLKPDVVHIHNVMPLISYQVVDICDQLSIPVVQTIHNYRTFCLNGMLFRDNNLCEKCVLNRSYIHGVIHKCYRGDLLQSSISAISNNYNSQKKFHRRISRYIFPSKFSMEYHNQHSKIFRNKSVMINHFVDYIPEKILPKSKRPLIAYVGRLSHEKGILDLLKICSFLNSVEICVVGDGPLKPVVERFSRSYSNIMYLGFKSKKEINQVMQKSWFTVIPSRYFETGPLVALESFVNGTGIIAPNMGTFSDLVTNSKTGFLYKPYNQYSLKETILSCINNRNYATNVGQFARKKYIKISTKNIFFKKLMNVYSSQISL